MHRHVLVAVDSVNVQTSILLLTEHLRQHPHQQKKKKTRMPLHLILKAQTLELDLILFSDLLNFIMDSMQPSDGFEL